MHKAWKIRIILLLAILMLSALTPVHAQESINIGDTVEGEMRNGTSVEYSFEANAGELIYISMASEDFDTYLYLLDDSGRELASNDDSGDGVDSLISAFSIPADGTYVIRASSFSGDASGTFTLTLDTLDANQIEYGQTVEGSANGPVVVYVFNGNEGDLVVANLRAEGFDTFIEMTEPSGFNYTAGQYIDEEHTRLGPTVLAETGTYTLNVTAADAFTLSLRRVDPISTTLGETASGTFDENTNELYFGFEGGSGQVVDFIANSGNTLDTRMDLVGPFGYSINSNDDARGTVDPALEAVVIDSDGTYYVVLSPSNPNASLSGKVSLKVTEAQLASLDAGPVDLEFGLDTSEQVLTFEGVSGERVRVTIDVVETSEFASPFVEVLQEGEILADINHSGVERVSFELTIPSDGPVNVLVQAYSELRLTVTLERVTE